MIHYKSLKKKRKTQIWNLIKKKMEIHNNCHNIMRSNNNNNHNLYIKIRKPKRKRMNKSKSILSKMKKKLINIKKK